MAFPVVEATVTDNDSGDPIAIALPTGITAGDLILVGVAHTTTADTPATPSGYALLAADGMSTDGYVVWTKTAVGGETTVSANFAASQSIASFAYRISGWSSIEISAASQGGSGTQPDAPSFTPAGGAADILWITCVFCSASLHGDATSPAPPTNYSDGVARETTDGITIKSARRFLNTTNQNPGVWDCSGTTHGWDGRVIAVYPLADTFTGTGASTLDGVTSAGSGTYTPPATTGTGASTLDGVTSAGSGTYTPAGITGTGTSTLDGVASTGSGTFTLPGITGTGASTLAGVTSSGSGTVANPITGTGASTLAGVTSVGVGFFGDTFLPEITCETLTLGAACETTVLPVACAILSLGVECEQ